MQRQPCFLLKLEMKYIYIIKTKRKTNLKKKEKQLLMKLGPAEILMAGVKLAQPGASVTAAADVTCNVPTRRGRATPPWTNSNSQMLHANR